MTVGITRNTRISSKLGIGKEALPGCFSGSIRKTFSASALSVTGWARAAMERPVMAIRSSVSWSIVNETRSSRARLPAF